MSGLEPPVDDQDAILFDLDRVLVRLPVDIAAVRARLSELYRSLGSRVFRPLLASMAEAEREARARLGAQHAASLAREAAAIVSTAEVEAAASSPALPGLRCLRLAQQQGIPVAVVSNNTRRGIRAALEAHSVDARRLAIAVSREDVRHAKPSGDMLWMALAEVERRYGTRSRVVMVGDAPSDTAALRDLDARLHAARADGRRRAPVPRCLSIGVFGGGWDLERLRAGSPDVLVADPELLAETLFGVTGDDPGWLQ